MVALNETEINSVTELIFKTHQLDFRQYAKSSLSRRLTRIMSLNALNSLEDLNTYLIKIPDKNLLIEEVTVNTTEMFRDPTFWIALRNSILPELNTHDNIRIWHAGCSSGEEVMSMQILLRELKMEHKTTAYATDLDQAILNRAQKANYSFKNLELNKANYHAAGGEYTLENYFKETNALTYTFDEDFLNSITFKRFDLVHDIMYTKFDLILCRNVLIYFDFDLQEKVIKKFTTNLFSGGFIAIGLNETILSAENLNDLNLYNAKEKIYRYKR